MGISFNQPVWWDRMKVVFMAHVCIVIYFVSWSYISLFHFEIWWSHTSATQLNIPAGSFACDNCATQAGRKPKRLPSWKVTVCPSQLAVLPENLCLKDTFPESAMRFPNDFREGWGLATSPNNLIMPFSFNIILFEGESRTSMRVWMYNVSMSCWNLQSVCVCARKNVVYMYTHIYIYIYIYGYIYMNKYL